MKKVTLYLDDGLWRAWRVACLNRGISASEAAEHSLRVTLEAWADLNAIKTSVVNKGATT